MMNKLAIVGLVVAASFFAVGCASETTPEEKKGSSTSNFEGDEGGWEGGDWGGDEGGGDWGGEGGEDWGSAQQDEGSGETEEASWRDYLRCMDRTSGADCDRTLGVASRIGM